MAAKKNNPNLTQKQKNLVLAFVRTGSYKQAALEAGYSEKSAARIGSETMKKPKVKKYLNQVMSIMQKGKVASAKEVMEYLTSVLRGKQTDATITPTGAVVKLPVSTKQRLAAAKEILKRSPDDKLSRAQIRKLLADAKLSEAKVKALSDNGEDSISTLDKLLDIITNTAKDKKKD